MVCSDGEPAICIDGYGIADGARQCHYTGKPFQPPPPIPFDENGSYDPDEDTDP